MHEDLLWVEKHRPRSVKDCILAPDLQAAFERMAENPETITHMILEGSPGSGKTSVARALANDIGADVLFLNASNDRGIDTVRNEIVQFSSSVSLGGNGRKVVILDESDALSGLAQSALRGVFEEFSKNAIFILTCNYKNKIMEAIHSRCAVYSFRLQKEDKAAIAGQFMKRVKGILDSENVSYDQRVLAELIMKFMPDWRKLLNELQKFSVVGRIDNEILRSIDDEKFEELIQHIKSKNYTEARKWVALNTETDNTELFRKIYDNMSKLLEPSCIPLVVTILARYQYQDAFVVDKEINAAALIAELSADAVFK